MSPATLFWYLILGFVGIVPLAILLFAFYIFAVPLRNCIGEHFRLVYQGKLNEPDVKR